ncbi:MAG: 2-polyprenylphenol 6-hydroxylase [Beijerinckiaceae bacterium]
MIFKFRSFARLTRAGFVLARAGVFNDVDATDLPGIAKLGLSLAKLIAKRQTGPSLDALPGAMGKLGPSYIKLGQFLSTRPDVVGPAVVKQLEKLQDRAAPFSRDIALAEITAAFGRPWNSIFLEVGEPVAAASIAQVHKARVRDDLGERDVAVKVRRPGVERLLRRDLADMAAAARFVETAFPETRRLKPAEVVETLNRAIKMETDFRIEAAAASEFAENVAGETDFRVPTIDWERTTKEVLTQEWIDGIKLSDIEALAAKGYDLPDLGREVIQSFLRHAMRDGFFHADMHQGNLFIDASGRLTAVDFGIMGRLGLKERRFLAEILYGFIKRDYRRVAEVHFEAGYVPGIHRVEDFAQAIRAIGEPIHSRTADQISMAKLLTLLFEITGLFDMKTRTELVLLQKTMVVVEGVARTLNPRLDMWSTAEPVVGAWIEANLGPVGKLHDAGASLASLAKFAGHLPAILLRAERTFDKLENLADNGFELSNEAIEQMGAVQARASRLGHYALWALVGLAAYFLLR